MIPAACRRFRRSSRWPSRSATDCWKPKPRAALAPPTFMCSRCETWTRPNTGLNAASASALTATGSAVPPTSISLGTVALERFDDARTGGEAELVLLDHLNAALHSYEDALDLTPIDDHGLRAAAEQQLGNTYRRAGDTRQALRHYQQAIQHHEARGNIYGAGQTRHGIALLLGADGQISDALHYARAALDDYQQVGPGAASNAADAEQFIAELEPHNRRPD